MYVWPLLRAWSVRGGCMRGPAWANASGPAITHLMRAPAEPDLRAETGEPVWAAGVNIAAHVGRGGDREFRPYLRRSPAEVAASAMRRTLDWSTCVASTAATAGLISLTTTRTTPCLPCPVHAAPKLHVVLGLRGRTGLCRRWTSPPALRPRNTPPA